MEEEYIYSPNKKHRCNKTSKESADLLFKMLGLDLVDGKIVKVEKPKPEPIIRSHIEIPEPPKKKGVKKGTKRGSYKTEKKQQEDPNRITTTCKCGCGQEFTYIRKGKRLKDFYNNAHKQRYYREQKQNKKMEEYQKDLL